MEINSIENGIVIDHIRAGRGTKMLSYLNLDMSTCRVAFIMNASSKKYGKKDIIKIENCEDIDFSALGLLDRHATVNIIKNGEIVEKINLVMPKEVIDVVKCTNPRCVTSIERGIKHKFKLIEGSKGDYKCEYCDDIVTGKTIRDTFIDFVRMNRG